MGPAVFQEPDFTEFWSSVGGGSSQEPAAAAFLRKNNVDTFRQLCERDLEINFISSLDLPPARRRKAADFCLAARQRWQQQAVAAASSRPAGFMDETSQDSASRGLAVVRRAGSKELAACYQEKILVDHSLIQRLRSNSAPEADLMGVAAKLATAIRQPRVAFDETAKGGQGRPGEDVSGDDSDSDWPNSGLEADSLSRAVTLRRDRRSWRYKCLRKFTEASGGSDRDEVAAGSVAVDEDSLSLQRQPPAAPCSLAASTTSSKGGSSSKLCRNPLPPPPPASLLPPPPPPPAPDATKLPSTQLARVSHSVSSSPQHASQAEHRAIQRNRSNSAPMVYTKGATVMCPATTDQLVVNSDVNNNEDADTTTAGISSETSMDWPLSEAEKRDLMQRGEVTAPQKQQIALPDDDDDDSS